MSQEGIELLRKIFKLVSSDTKIVKPVRQCIKCHKKYKLDRHHIIYKPAKIALLCRGCHIEITNANLIAAIVLKRKLTNKDRTKLWKWFLKLQGSVTEDKVIEALGVKYTFSVADYIRYSSMQRIRS